MDRPDDTTKRRDGDPEEGRLLHLTRAQFAGSLAISVAAFFFATGPLWRHPGDIRLLDHAIGWSYAVIPLLVGACLVAGRRWSWRGFFLDSLAMALCKFVITAGAAAALWVFVAPPDGPHVHVPPSATPAAEEPTIVPTPIDAARTGTLRITVVDATGRAVPGAIAYVASGFPGYVFAPPAKPVELTQGAGGVSPSLAAAMAGQRVSGRSTDGRLHTLRATRDGVALFNVPLLGSGEPTTVRVGEAAGLAIVRCNVHPTEGEGRLLVVASPWFGATDASGGLHLVGVPAGKVSVAAVSEHASAPEVTVEVAPLQGVDVRLTLAP